MTESELEAGRQFDKTAWMENISVSIRNSAAASRKRLTNLKSTKSLKAFDEGKDAPKEYVCPVSLQLMRDPVLLVETGQVYDRESIDGWFKSGHNTDPVTGVRLSGKRLSPVFPLRSAIHDFAKKHSIELDPIDEADERSLDEKENDGKDPMDIEPASAVGLAGISVYDVQALCSLFHSSNMGERIAAMKLLADMARYGDSKQMKRVTKCITVDTLVTSLSSDVVGLRAQAARLLLHLPGDHVSLLQCLQFIKLPNIQLREEAMLTVWQMAYRNRSKMLDVAKAVEEAGAQELIDVIKPLADTTMNDDTPEEARAYAAFVLCCMVLRPSLRAHMIHEEVAPLLLHFLNTTTDVGFRFCLLKASQYLCEDPRGRQQVRQAGGTRIFVLHLPPRNKLVLYSTRLFLDWFAWVTVAETAVKGMFHLSKDDGARQEMRTTGTIAALRAMNRESKFQEACRHKYLGPLIGRLNTP